MIYEKHEPDTLTLGGLCRRCGQDFDSPNLCRELSGAVRIVDPTRPGHQEVQVFVGHNEGSRGNTGSLTLRVEELSWFLSRMKRAGFSELAPLYAEGREKAGPRW